MTDRTATGRLRRLLTLVPFVLSHQGVTVAEAAARFGVSERELIDDLNLLFVCGLPGYSHMELIEVSYESGEVFIRNADVISAPMRLHRDEALTLLLGLHVIEQLADADQREAIADLRAKILAGSTESLESASSRIAILPEQTIAVGATVAEALNRQRRLLISYYVPSRDEVTEREVDPISIASIEGSRYLRAWCRSAEGLRHFRLDRIESAKIIDRPAAPPTDLASDVERAFVPPPHAEAATLRVKRPAQWLIDFLGADVVTVDGEETEIRVTVGDVERIMVLIRQMGDAVRLIQPDVLRTAARDRAAAALALYADPA